mgnify:FL=1
MNNSNVNKKARLTARQELSPQQREELLESLKACFEKNKAPHGIALDNPAGIV